ncbi:MAG TPA: dienelactone hydrolase family protein [Bdellovibrionales bacterium]|nr:dienelactone hydrolase family protein [Bdellovibrionales bacterium]HCM38514.1 dienelactone hydrolase family protein [Bdellovibrionales bacterium]
MMNSRVLTATFWAILLTTGALTQNTAWAARSTPIEVKEKGATFQGDLYVPEKGSPTALPLVIVVHEWWGKTDYPKKRAAQIADELGYAALAVDLYGTAETVSDPKNAQAKTKPFYDNPELGVSRIRNFIAAAPAAANKLDAAVDLKQIAAVGFCFGGSQVLNLARSGKLPKGQQLLGVVSFHGGLASSLKSKGKIDANILVLHGDADPMVPKKDIVDFKNEMKKAKADLRFIAYPGAKHAFTNPEATETGIMYKMPIEYDPEATTKAWAEMKTFLRQIFRAGK